MIQEYIRRVVDNQVVCQHLYIHITSAVTKPSPTILLWLLNCSKILVKYTLPLNGQESWVWQLGSFPDWPDWLDCCVLIGVDAILAVISPTYCAEFKKLICTNGQWSKETPFIMLSWTVQMDHLYPIQDTRISVLCSSFCPSHSEYLLGF